MNLLITTTIAGLAWWPQGRHDVANTGRVYGHGDFPAGSFTINGYDLPYGGRYGLAAGEVTGDGVTEIITVFNGRVALYAPNGAPGPSVTFSGYEGFGGTSPAIADFRLANDPAGIHIPDVAGVLRAVTSLVYIWAPHDPGVVVSLGYADRLSGLRLADLDSDGIPEMIAVGARKLVSFKYSPASNAILLLWETSLAPEARTGHVSPAVGDVNGDGNPEIVTAGVGPNAAYACVYLYDLAGSKIWSSYITGYEGHPSQVSSPTLLNLDQDPQLEIVFLLENYRDKEEPAPGKRRLYLVAYDDNGTQLDIEYIGFFPMQPAFPDLDPPRELAVGDINNDGSPDIVLTTTQTVHAYKYSGGFIPLWTFDYGFGPSSIKPTSPPVLADLDNDSDLDVLCGLGHESNPNYVYLYILDGATGALRTQYTLRSQTGGDGWDLPLNIVADVDDDFHLEVVSIYRRWQGISMAVIDGSPIQDRSWGAVPLSNYNPQPNPLWRSRFYDASVMPPDRAIDRFYGIDPNLVSDTMVAVGEFGFTFPQAPMPPFSYYSRDRGETWNISVLTDPYPIDGFDSMGWEYHLYGVHLSKQLSGFQAPVNGVAVGWALASKYPFMPVEPFWYGCILITTDGGKTWQDETGDLLGVSNPLLLPGAPLTDAVIATDGADHKTWIVGLGGYVYTGRLTSDGLKQVSSPPTCFGDKAPYPDLYGVHAYYPYPGTVQNFVWVVGKSWQGGYIDWGYMKDPDNPLSMVWGTPPHCSDTVEYFCDAIYDLWAQGAQMPSLPGYSYSWNEAGITDSAFVVGKSKPIAPVGATGLIWGTTDRMGSYEQRVYQDNKAFYDISTLEYPALRRYVFGEGPIRYWDVNFTEEDGLLPDETPPIAIKNDLEVGPVPPDRILYGSADNAGIAVGRMSISGLPTIWKKGSFEYVASGDLSPVPFGPPEITWTRSQSNWRVAWVVWNHNTEPTVRDYRIRAYPMGQASGDWSSLLTFNVETFLNTPSDSGHWDAIGLKAVDYWGTESQASDDAGDTSLFYHPGPGAVSDTLALFPSSSENLVMDNDGVAHLVYASRSLEDGEYHIYYIYRPFGGSWSEPQDLGKGYAPTLAFWNSTNDFASATLLLAYTVHQGKTSKLMMRKKGPGGSWSPARMLAVFNPSSPYLGMGAPDILDVFRGGQSPTFMGTGDPPRAYVAMKAPVREGRKDRVRGYRLLMWAVDPISLSATGPEVVDSISVSPFDVPDREAFLSGVGGVSITGIKVFNQYHQHIAWDTDGNRLSVLWRRNPGHPWNRMNLSGNLYGYASEAKEPYIMAVGGASAPPDTYSVVYITFCGRNNNAQPYSVYLSYLYTHQPAGFPWRVSDGTSDTKNPILSGWNWWSQKVGNDWEIFKGNPWGYRILLSKTPWARSSSPQYTWGTNPYYEVALYLEEDPKDGECGLIRRGYEPSPITSQMWSFGDSVPTPATVERGGFIVYDTVRPAMTVDTASSRLSYLLPDWNLNEGEEYALNLVFYHQEPDTQALRVVVYSDTYTVYVPPNEEWFWEAKVLVRSPISFSVEKLDAERAFLSGAYLFPVEQGKGGPQSQGPGGISFSFNAYPTVSRDGFNIQLSLPVRQDIDISLYDVTGRMALSLARGVYAPGAYTFTVSPHQLSSGIYYLRLTSPQYRETRKLILTK